MRSSVLTEILSVQRLGSSTKEAFEEASVGSLWGLHRGKQLTEHLLGKTGTSTLVLWRTHLLANSFANQADELSKFSAYLQVIARLLAVGDSLDLSGGGHIHGLTHVGEAKRPGDAHVRQWQVIHVQQRPEARQTTVHTHVA